MPGDTLTGLRVDLELELDVDPRRLWELITDLSRIGEWNPECVYARWLDGRETGETGARFEARNRFSNGFVGEVVCEVTEFLPPRRFGWKVLGSMNEPERPGSFWRYELLPASERSGDGRVLVRHSFEHGPGVSGLREAIRKYPEHRQEILDTRLRELRRNMTTTLEAMAEHVRTATTGHGSG